ncbi:unnamed protein product, partial [Owenia fusiformis]
TQSARMYSEISGESCEEMIAELLSLFYFMFAFSTIAGNIAGSVLLNNNDNTTEIPEDELDKCGPEFCPAVYNATNDNLSRPPEELIQLLMIIFIVLCLSAALLMIFALEKLDYEKKATKDGKVPNAQEEKTPLIHS